MFPRLLQWLTEGKDSIPPRFDNPEPGVQEISDLLRGGLGEKHLESEITHFDLLVFSGVDGSGVDPDLGCSLPSALVGNQVRGLFNVSDFSDASSSFENLITIDDEIQQSELDDLSTETYLLLLKRGVNS